MPPGQALGLDAAGRPLPSPALPQRGLLSSRPSGAPSSLGASPNRARLCRLELCLLIPLPAPCWGRFFSQPGRIIFLFPAGNSPVSSMMAELVSQTSAELNIAPSPGHLMWCRRPPRGRQGDLWARSRAPALHWLPGGGRDLASTDGEVRSQDSEGGQSPPQSPTLRISVRIENES